MEKNAVIFILGGIVVVLAVVLAYQYFGAGFAGFGGAGGVENIMSKDEAGKFTLDFIKEELASPDTEFTLLSVEEDNGMYKVNFEVMEETDSAYVTKNGEYLFFQPYVMIPLKVAKPEVDLYVMSFCPFGNQAEELIMPVVDLLGDSVDISLHYIFYNNYCTSMADRQIAQGSLSLEEKNTFINECKPEYCIEGEKYCSMHGIQELNQGIREFCVQKYQSDKLWEFVKAINAQTDYENVDSQWQEIAGQIGIDINKIVTCQEQEILDIAAEEVKLTSEFGVKGSPALFINGNEYNGSRDTNGYKEGICKTFENPPAECEQDLISSAAPSGSCQ